MAAAAEITYGTPLNLELAGAYVDLGAEQRDGQHVIVLAVDDGEGYAHLELTAEDADLLADALHGLATVTRNGAGR